MEHTAPADIKPWLENLVWFFGLVLICIKLFKEFKGGENKREVTLTDDCVCKKEFKEFQDYNRDEHNNLFKKIGGVERGGHAAVEGVENKLMQRLEGMASQDKQSRAEMHKEIGNLAREVSSIQTAVDLTAQRTVEVNNKLDRIIENHHAKS